MFGRSFCFCVLYAKNLEGVEKGERLDWCPPPTNSDEGTHKEKIRSSLIIIPFVTEAAVRTLALGIWSSASSGSTRVF